MHKKKKKREKAGEKGSDSKSGHLQGVFALQGSS